jgi:hypothetical protein
MGIGVNELTLNSSFTPKPRSHFEQTSRAVGRPILNESYRLWLLKNSFP